MKTNRLAYAFMLAALILFVFFYNKPVAWTALYAFLLLPVLSLFTALSARKRLSFSQGFDKEQIFKGESFIYRVQVKNKGMLYYPNIAMHFYTARQGSLFMGELPRVKSIELLPKRDFELSVSFSCRYSGNYDFGLSKIEVYDYLGLFRITKQVGDSTLLTVFPRVNEMFDFPFESQHLSETQSSFDKRDEDYAIIADVRKYEPGDSVKKIHWKLSARKSEILVKNFQANSISSSVFICDTNAGARDEVGKLMIEDAMLEDIVSAESYCCRSKFPLELRYGLSGKVQTLDNNEGFEAVYARTAALAFNEDNDFTRIIDFCVSELKESTNIICFSKTMAAGVCEIVKDVRSLGHNIVLFAYDRKSGDTEALIRDLYTSGISCVFKEL